MSQQPQWVTKEGSLGTVPEGEFYKISLLAIDPDFPTDPNHIIYSLHAGELPKVIAVNLFGIIEGIPESIIDVKGVPHEVAENIESKFTIRAKSTDLRINDRTFSIVVTGQDTPKFITPAGSIGQYYDGDKVDFQFEYSDSDSIDNLEVTLIGGSIPAGTTLSLDGNLTGYIAPTPTLDGSLAHWDNEGLGWDLNPIDYDATHLDTNFEFTLQVSDGKDIDIRTFRIFVYSSDGVKVRKPLLIEYIPDFGRIRHDNFFAYQFKGLDPDLKEVTYELEYGYLPPDLTLDQETGWLSGYLTNVHLTELEYKFVIRVIKFDGITASIPYEFTFTVVGQFETEGNWVSPRELGYINNGEISNFYVEASYSDVSLSYRLAPGAYSKLPQGLQLQTSGNIVGRVSFKAFSIDLHTTTFDLNFETRLDVDLSETSFDRTFLFNVEAYSADGTISTFKEFIIRLGIDSIIPYNTMYAKATPPIEDRQLIDELLLNPSIMIPEILYRPDDLNFGVAREVVYIHAYGLHPASLADYYNAMERNHYRKRLTLGEIKTARALDDNGDVLYEVVYSAIIDDMVNQYGESVSDVIDLNANAINNGPGDVLDLPVTEVYPNSLENMRDQVINKIGQISKILPRWMLSKQQDGRVLGFIPSWVIAYTKPGHSSLLAYRIENEFDQHINQFDFDIDRFTLDNRLTKDWTECADDDIDCETGWADGIMTTFDRFPTVIDCITADTVQDYASSPIELHTTLCDGSPLAPPPPIGRFEGWDETPYDYFSYDFTQSTDNDKPYNPFGQESETIFDGGSCRFISPIDVFEITDEHDKYILYPQSDIVTTITVV